MVPTMYVSLRSIRFLLLVVTWVVYTPYDAYTEPFLLSFFKRSTIKGRV